MKNVGAVFTLALVAALGGCRDDGPPWWERAFAPHECAPPYRLTPGGRLYCAHERPSVAEGWTTEAELAAAIDATLDAAEVEFGAAYDSRVPIWLHDDYVYWSAGAATWAAGDTYGRGTRLRTVVWSRKTGDSSPSEPVFVLRGPDFCTTTCPTGYRWAARPLVPALRHEWGHHLFGPGFEH